MKKLIVFIFLIVSVAGCKKTVEAIQDDFIVKALTDGNGQLLVLRSTAQISHPILLLIVLNTTAIKRWMLLRMAPLKKQELMMAMPAP